MTLPNSTSKGGPYAGAGTTGPFVVPFYFLQNTDLLVTKTSVAGVDTNLNYPADYAVSGVGNPLGGSVTPTVAIAVGEKLTINRNVPLTQGVSLPTTGPLPSASMETEYDKLTMIDQQQQGQIDRTIKIPVSSTNAAPTISDFTGFTGTVPLYNDTTKNFDVGPSASQISNAQTYATQAQAAAASAAVNANYYASTSGGTGDAVTATVGLSAYSAGQEFTVWMTAANTLTNPTINFDGKGAKTIKRIVSGGKTALWVGDYYAGFLACFKYDGTDMVLMNPNGLYASLMASIGTGADLTGTDTINIYGQVDMYSPNSTQGAVGSATFNGPSISTSKGTGTVPLINLTNDYIGGVNWYAYSGASPAYNCHALIAAKLLGATANNLGGGLEFYTKADGGALTKHGSIDQFGVLNMLNASPTFLTPTLGDNTTKAATTAFVTAAIAALTANVKTVKKQVFTSSGTYTPSTGMLYCLIEMVGGGGGGGGIAGAGGLSGAGAAGGSGGYSRLLATAATIGASKAVTVGANGTAGAAGANAGSAGGASSVGSLCIANGGGGGSGTNSTNSGIGGPGASSSGVGDISGPGNPGAIGTFITGNVSMASGPGGSTVFGGGAIGTSINQAGPSALGYGGGGAGGSCQNAASNFAGGNGFTGIVYITEFCSQ